MIDASIVSEFWNEQILAHDRQGVFLVLVGFILSFAFSEEVRQRAEQITHTRDDKHD